MDGTLQETLPAFSVFAVLVLVMATASMAFEGDLTPKGPAFRPVPRSFIDLPLPAEDADRDSYADDVDRVAGDALVFVSVTLVASDLDAPYVTLSTQDDQWRFGAERELAWRHVVDPDPLGHKPGSPAWQRNVLQHGAHWRADLDPDTPILLAANVRDDIDVVTLQLSLRDAHPSPHREEATWALTASLDGTTWRIDDAIAAQGELVAAGPVEVGVTVGHDMLIAEKEAVAARWAPVLHFASDEAFRPTQGEVLERFHGFYERPPDHATWTQRFNNGRDLYRLLVADFNGDGTSDHRDVLLLTDILRTGGTATDTVYAHVTRGHGGQVVIQYWFITFYNYILDETGADIDLFAHAGDREFIQLVFGDLEAALDGRPDSISYSQHYHGIRIDSPDAPWLWQNGTHPHVYVAHGSHASYPVAGNDERLRRSFIAYGDVFDGQGETWLPEDYSLELLAAQPWHAGYKWGPATRFHRDLGTTTQPLLQHHFQYPFIDPLAWSSGLRSAGTDRLHELYNTPEEARP